MNGNRWFIFRPQLSAVALLLLGCSSSARVDPHTEVKVAALTSPATAGTEARHLRVLVSYEAGRFQVEKVTQVDQPLRQPRSGLTRNGLQYLAQTTTGVAPFRGAAPDPRGVHVETTDSTGALQRIEAPAPGKQHLLIYVPVGTEMVDFFEPTAAQQSAGFQPAGARSSISAGPAPIGSIDLRAAAK